MIQINLLPQKKALRMPEVMGVDLNHLNLKMIGVALILHIFSVPWAESWMQGQKVDLEKQLTDKDNELKVLMTEGQVSKQIQDEVDKLLGIQEKLQGKLAIVKKILEIKQNPLQIMLYLSKNIPKDAWIKHLSIENEKILLEGEAGSYKSIGVFIDSLQGSIFFGNSITLEDSRTLTDPATNKRSEVFKISGKIQRYE